MVTTAQLPSDLSHFLVIKKNKWVKIFLGLTLVQNRDTAARISFQHNSLVFWFQIQKGKVHGSIDVGLSVMSIKKKARRIDLDTEEHIYHLKVKLSSASGISRGWDLNPVRDSQEMVSTAVFPCFLFQVKSQDWFDAWVSKLRHHRLYRQNEIVRSPRDASFHIFPAASTAESSPAANVSVVEGKVRHLAVRNRPGNHLEMYSCTSLCVLENTRKRSLIL